jgi:hypothetical protein
MITAVVRYKLPPQIDYAACREHFHKIDSAYQLGSRALVRNGHLIRGVMLPSFGSR